MADDTPSSGDSETPRCGHCGVEIGHATRRMHGECFPEHRDPELKASEPARCTITMENGDRCPKPKISHDWCGTHRQRWARTGHPLGNRSTVGKWKMCHFCTDDMPREKRRAVSKDSGGNPLCRKHHARWKRHGDATTTVRRQFVYTDDLDADFWALVDTKGGDVDQCWPWTGSANIAGYGVFLHYGAHRNAYRITNGDIPEGMVIDHVCHDPEACPGGSDCPHRICCNPSHLAPALSSENTARGRSSAHVRTHDGLCQVPGCGREYAAAVNGRRLCPAHYQRSRKHDGETFDHVPIGHGGKRLHER